MYPRACRKPTAAKPWPLRAENSPPIRNIVSFHDSIAAVRLFNCEDPPAAIGPSLCADSGASKSLNRRSPATVLGTRPKPVTAFTAMKDFTALLEKENERNRNQYRKEKMPQLSKDLEEWHKKKKAEEAFWAEAIPVEDLVQYSTHFPKSAPKKPAVIPFKEDEVRPSPSSHQHSSPHLKGVAAVYSPRNAASIRSEALFALLGDAMLNSVNHPVPNSIKDSHMQISPAIDLAV